MGEIRTTGIGACAIITPLEVKRLTVANGVLNTICTSELQQVAINNISHLTILDPKLPLLHEALGKSSETNGSDKIFNSSAFYTVSSVVPWENLIDSGVGYLSKVLLGDTERRFNFSRVAELQVTQHSWSQIDDSSRDCFLGVLANTGELFILQRETLDRGNYAVRHRLLVFLCERLQIPLHRFSLENELLLYADEKLFLRVNAFQFGKLANGTLVLNIVHEDGQISVYSLDESLKLLSSYVHTGSPIVLLVWSSASNSFYHLSSDNSVYAHVLDTLGISEGKLRLVKAPTRFLVSQMKLFGSQIVVVDAQALHAIDIEGRATKTTLPIHSIAVGLHLFSSKRNNYAFIVYEGGKSLVVSLSQIHAQLLPNLEPWEDAMSQICQRYRYILQKEQRKAILRVFVPYLDDDVDAELTVHGTTLVLDKYIMVVHSSLPKNTIGHMYVSLKLFTLSLIPVATLLPEVELSTTSNCTFPFLINMFLESGSSLPFISKGVLDGSKQSVETFLLSLSSWKNDYLSAQPNVLPPIEGLDSLQEGLITFFREEPAIHTLQRHFTANVSILRSLLSLTPNTESENEIESYKEFLHTEQILIALMIRQRLARIVLLTSNSCKLDFASQTDKLILLSYFLVISAPEEYSEIIPDNVRLSISTELCAETFEMNKSDALDTNYITSCSGHNWRRCDLSLLPILELSNDSDELEIHSYVSSADDSEILKCLFNSVNYCIYTGTRRKALAAGI